MYKWDVSKQYRIIVKCALSISAACLTRYEGWLLPVGLIFAILLILLFSKAETSKTSARSVSVCCYHIQFGWNIVVDILEYGYI
jgi:hypothetical protein